MPDAVKAGSIMGGRGWDLAFLYGSAAVAVGAGLVALSAPQLVVPLWLLWLWLVDGPHLAATYTRTYLDARTRRERAGLLLASFLWLAPGFVALAASEATGNPAAFQLYLALATLWSIHHNARQHYGILSIVERHAGATAAAKRRDVWFLYASLWGLFLLFLFGHPASRVALQLPEVLPGWAETALAAAAITLGSMTVIYLVDVGLRVLRGADPRPALFVLVPAVGVQAFALVVVASHEPLIAKPTDPEQAFLAVAFVGGIVHGLQYLGIVFAANRRREAAAARRYRPLLVYAVLVAASALYMLVNLARGASPWGGLAEPGSLAARAFLAFYWGLFFHHYYLDQKIWRPHADKVVRAELGL
jgi:hypothetical protein